MTKLTFQVSLARNRSRLDAFLFDAVPDLSKMYLREIIKTGGCEVNGASENSGYRLRANDFIELEADMSRGTAMRPENVDVDIVFEDDDLLVVNKPAGMLVHPTHRDKNGTLLNALTFHLNKARAGEGHFIRPGLVHRLDKQTSGLMVVARTSRAHRILAEHFKRKLVSKRYLALVDGTVAADEGKIREPIGRFAEHKHWGIKHDGKDAETRFRVRKRKPNATLLELEPVTGRTNQLRIHCASFGHPIVGDIQRGGSAAARLCLHAFRLAFNHPTTGERMEFFSEAPAEFGPPNRAVEIT